MQSALFVVVAVTSRASSDSFTSVDPLQSAVLEQLSLCGETLCKHTVRLLLFCCKLPYMNSIFNRPQRQCVGIQNPSNAVYASILSLGNIQERMSSLAPLLFDSIYG